MMFRVYTVDDRQRTPYEEPTPLQRLQNGAEDCIKYHHRCWAFYARDVVATDAEAMALEISQVLRNPMNGLEELQFNDCCFGVQNLRVIRDQGFSSEECKVQKLRLGGHTIVNEEESQFWIETIPRSKFQALTLEFPVYCTDQPINFLLKVVPESDLKELCLPLHTIRGEDFPPLLGAIKVRNSIETLRLHGNRIGDEGIRILAEYIASSQCRVRDLNVTNTGITEDGLKVLFPIVKRSLIASFSSTFHQFDDRGPFPIRHFNRIMSSQWSKVILALLSCAEVPRIGRHSALKLVPKDLIRHIAETLPLSM